MRHVFKMKCSNSHVEQNADEWLYCWIPSPSGPMRAYVLAREDAICHWRELMGPTKVFRARYTSPASIRAQFGLTDTRNTTHGSGRKCVECGGFMRAGQQVRSIRRAVSSHAAVSAGSARVTHHESLRTNQDICWIILRQHLQITFSLDSAPN